jgi:hypothetical protein
MMNNHPNKKADFKRPYFSLADTPTGGRCMDCGNCQRRLYQGFVPRRSPDSDE